MFSQPAAGCITSSDELLLPCCMFLTSPCRVVVACARGWGCWVGMMAESGLKAMGAWKVSDCDECLLKKR